MTQQNNKIGIWLMVLTTLIFALQDGMSRHLADAYNSMMVVMIRYWFFAAFVVALAARQPGGLRKAVKSQRPGLQILRGALLAIEIIVAIIAFVLLGLIESHAVFAVYPLLIAALSGPVLGEQVGWRRWVAIGVGFVGMLIILNPSSGVFSLNALVPFISALMFAVYGLMTRYMAQRDGGNTSFFYTGVAGMVVSTLVGIWFWEPMSRPDWIWMLVLSVSGVAGHFTLIKCYDYAEASAVQPFAYLHLVWASGLGIFLFGETLKLNVAFGAAIIVSAGLFTLWRARLSDES
ncbi:MAG: DMT family transporter [Pelagimonas sp.]|jgi:drug/metabolite transporter (DMT)-like permease|nr:DMT family transporter [Pelagimonas sp.]